MFFPVCGVLPVPIVVLFLSKNTVYYRKRRQQYNVYIRFCELENFHIYALRIWSPFLLKMKGNSYDDYNTPDTICKNIGKPNMSVKKSQRIDSGRVGISG